MCKDHSRNFVTPWPNSCMHMVCAAGTLNFVPPNVPESKENIRFDVLIIKYKS